MPRQHSRWRIVPLLLLSLLAAARYACAGAALFLEEPFGVFGKMNPTGHAAVYLSHVCADSPTRLRLCNSGEEGVVISRYHHVGGYDWLAIPLIPYLYAVERPEQVPPAASPEMVEHLRDQYRRAYLRGLAPDDDDGGVPGGEWIQLIGAAYDRKIYSFEIVTTPEQDQRLIDNLNSSRNRTHFNLLIRNCADFARGILNTYYPHAARRSWFADQGITTPNQIAKSVVGFSKHHPDLQFSSFTIAQVPGSLPRSGRVRGVFEAFLKSKKYIVPVAALHPLVAGGMAVAYLSMSRCDPRRNFTRRLDCVSQPTAVMAKLQTGRDAYAPRPFPADSEAPAAPGRAARALLRSCAQDL